jgi:hypothetical protein
VFSVQIFARILLTISPSHLWRAYCLIVYFPFIAPTITCSEMRWISELSVLISVQIKQKVMFCNNFLWSSCVVFRNIHVCDCGFSCVSHNLPVCIFHFLENMWNKQLRTIWFWVSHSILCSGHFFLWYCFGKKVRAVALTPHAKWHAM